LPLNERLIAARLLDINQTITEVIALSASELAKNQVSLRTELAADLQPVRGDRVQLQQVLLKLILNGNEAISKSTWDPREMVISSRETAPAEVTVMLRAGAFLCALNCAEIPRGVALAARLAGAGGK